MATGATASTRNTCGNYKDRLTDISRITFQDFENPWNFFTLFNSEFELLVEWLRNNGLLAREVECDKVVDGNRCRGVMTLKVKNDVKGGQVFRCATSRNHCRSFLKNSFFERTKIDLQDVFMFLKSYLDKNSLHQCAKFSGIAYKTTAVNWASMVRELFKEHFHRHTKNRIMSGVVEIDESLFGRRVKYHKGNPNKGLKVWIFGMVDRDANNVVIYPVSDRSADTLLPLIKRHVAPGATIYSDGWKAYFDLNDLGYRHFTVLHKYAFKKEYINVATGEVTTVNTNKIEGAWKHAKDHFRRIVGTMSGQFEGHLAEIMWRSEHKGNWYQAFFNLIQEVFPLEKPAEYDYTTPLFDSWQGSVKSSGDEEMDKVYPIESGAEVTSSENESDAETKQRPVSKGRSSISTLQLSSDDEADKTLTETPGKVAAQNRTNNGNNTAAISKAKNDVKPASVAGAKAKNINIKMDQNTGIISKTDNVRHPSGFVQAKKETKTPRRKHRKSNPYAKSAYEWGFDSSDDDFV